MTLREKSRKWRETHPEQKRKYSSAWYAKNSLLVKEKMRKRYVEQGEEIRAKRRHWRETNPEKVMLSMAKNRAKAIGVPFTITLEDICIPQTCPILGVPLVRGLADGMQNSPSLDRIIPELGYVPGNICVISHRANRIKTDATPDELRRVADYVCNALAG